MITFKQKGNFNNTERFIKRASKLDYMNVLHKYGKIGVESLALATPIDSGNTASSWKYEIENKNGTSKIIWSNTNVLEGVPLVILLQYGHGTNNGGYVQGNDFVTPVMKPIFKKIADEAWREVSSL